MILNFYCTGHGLSQHWMAHSEWLVHPTVTLTMTVDSGQTGQSLWLKDSAC